MATFTKIPLSGSTNGKNIEVAASATPGTLLHTAVTGTTDLDEIYIFALNSGSSSVTLTIEFGGVTSVDDHIKINLFPDKGFVMVVPGLLLQNGLVVRAFSTNPPSVNINGYVHRITA